MIDMHLFMINRFEFNRYRELSKKMKYFKFDSFKTQSRLAKRTVKKKKGQKEEEIEKKTKTKEKA